MYMHVSKHLNVSFLAENRATLHNIAQRALAPEQVSEGEEICCWKAGLATLKNWWRPWMGSCLRLVSYEWKKGTILSRIRIEGQTWK
jgi:hypothetical protein